MIKPDPDPQQLERLASKTLDQQFLNIIRNGLNCSPFEAAAVLDAVEEIYFPHLGSTMPAQTQPGRITLVAVCADESAGKPIADCAKRTISLMVHRGRDDDEIIVKQGMAAFRRARIPDLAQEALSQGVLLTNEDLAFHIFFVSTRTITADLQFLRQQNPPPHLPLRGTVQDIGPFLTHRLDIVNLALDGKTMSEIHTIMRHSPSAIANYLSTFARCAYLAAEGCQPGQIAFLLRKGRRLVEQYLQLAAGCAGDANRAYHLEELIRLETQGKKTPPPEMPR